MHFITYFQDHSSLCMNHVSLCFQKLHRMSSEGGKELTPQLHTEFFPLYAFPVLNYLTEIRMTEHFTNQNFKLWTQVLSYFINIQNNKCKNDYGEI